MLFTGDGFNTPLSRLSYLVLHTVVHLSLYLVFVRYQALNVKAGVKTREYDSHREHCMSREPPGYYFGERVLLPECSSRWPWRYVFPTCTLLPGATSTKGCWTFFLRTRLCTVRNYYWSKRFIVRNKTEKPSDEPPTDQEHRPGDRADQANRAQLIARSIISFGCLSLVK